MADTWTIKEGVTYTTVNTVLKVKPIKIFHQNDKKIVFKGILGTKNGEIVEIKTYKLPLSRITDWRIYEK